MATKIKLMRLGKMRAPYYRIVVADARNKRDGRVIETIGKYHPKEHPSFIEVDPDRAAYWLGVGAQATDPVERILKVTGDWQRFKGEAAPAPMLVAEPKVDKRVAFEAASLGNVEGGAGSATTPKKKAVKAERAEDVTPAQAPASAAAVPAEPAPAPAAETVAALPADEAAAAGATEAEPADEAAAEPAAVPAAGAGTEETAPEAAPEVEVIEPAGSEVPPLDPPAGQ